MKKLIAMMLAGAMLFAATGCSSDNGGSRILKRNVGEVICSVLS